MPTLREDNQSKLLVPDTTKLRIQPRKDQKNFSLRKEWFNPSNIRAVNIGYEKAKRKFTDASKSKKKKDLIDACNEYKKYCNEIYSDDIDAIVELGEICTQLEDYYDDALYCAIECFQKAATLEEKNTFYKIRLGESFARKRNWKESFHWYQKLHTKDRTNKTVLLNCAILSIKLSNNKKYAGKKDYYIKQFCKLFPADPKSAALQLSLSDAPADIKMAKDIVHEDLIQYTKGKAGEQRRLHSEQRLGVFIILRLFSFATKNQIKEQWLINANTTTQILRELVEGGYIKTTRMIDGNTMYQNMELGESYAVQYLHVIFTSLDNFQKDPKNRHKFDAVFTDRLVDAVKEWSKTSHVTPKDIATSVK